MASCHSISSVTQKTQTLVYGMAWYWLLSADQKHLSNVQPKVSAKSPAKHSVLSESWGGFASAEQGRVPGAAVRIPIGPNGGGCSSSWAQGFTLLCWEQRRSARWRSHNCPLHNIHRRFGAGYQNHSSHFTFFSFSLCYNPLMN